MNIVNGNTFVSSYILASFGGRGKSYLVVTDKNNAQWRIDTQELLKLAQKWVYDVEKKRVHSYLHVI